MKKKKKLAPAASKKRPAAKGKGRIKKLAPKPAAKTRRKTKAKVRPGEPPALPDCKPKPERPLSARQEKFCLHFVEEPTAAAAYRRAYGNTRTPDAAASRLLTLVKVQERIAALRQRAALTAVLTLAEKRQYLRRVVVTPIGEVDEHSDLCQAYERQEMGGTRGKLKRGNAEEGNEEEEPEYDVVKTKMPDKLRAIELDAKLAGELIDKHEHEHSADDGLLELLGAIRAGK